MNDERFVQDVSEFVWGTIVKVHEVGEYQIIEYRAMIFKNGNSTGKYEPKKTTFHVYGYNHSYGSLDMALIGAIALKHEGRNTRAPEYIFNMLKINQ